MKTKLFYFCSLLLTLTVFSCSNDNSESEDDIVVDEQQSLIVGDWTAISLGVIYENGTEESANDPCGNFQFVNFLADGTFSFDAYLLNNENCEFAQTRSGEYEEISDSNYPESNFRLIISATGDDDEYERYPEITFEGDNMMRIQYPWAGTVTTDIDYSFVIYQRN